MGAKGKPARGCSVPSRAALFDSTLVCQSAGVATAAGRRMPLQHPVLAFDHHGRRS
jgi:hypothetical protein